MNPLHLREQPESLVVTAKEIQKDWRPYGIGAQESLDGYVLFVGRKTGSSLADVVIYTLDDKGNVISSLRAKRGTITTQVTGVKAPESSQQTIRPDAKLLFVAGAGWTKKQPDGQAHVPEAAELIMGFLNATKASLGSSKSLVDLSGEGQAVLPFMSHLNQVGQTGSTPRHPKGLSTCCHGEEPHAVGWRFIGERRAINLDANCGWARGKADVLYVADAFEVMRKVNQLLGAR